MPAFYRVRLVRRVGPSVRLSVVRLSVGPSVRRRLSVVCLSSVVGGRAAGAAQRSIE
jgi:hypothetical protein